MAEDYVLSDDTVSAGPSLFEKVIKWFIIAAVLCLGAELVWLVGITPFRPFSRIDISGDAALSREEILSLAGITGKSAYFSTGARTVEKALAGISSIQSVRVFKHFPDRLEIVLEGRRAIASGLVSFNGRTVPVLFDSEGVVFRIGGDGEDTAPGRQDSLAHNTPQFDMLALPVISGLVIENPVLGMRLPAMFIPLFRDLEKIETSAPELLAAVSELRINPKSYDGYDLVLYPLHKKIKVRLSELNEDLLRYTLLMVDVLAARESGVDTLDFRGGIASYVPGEIVHKEQVPREQGPKEASSEQ